MRQKTGFNKNPLVGDTQTDTLENCVELLDFLQQRADDMHSGWNVNFALIRDALGHTMGQAAVETAAFRLGAAGK